MKKNLSSLIAIFLIACITIPISSCSKDDDDDGPSRTELLTSAPWKYQAASINPGIDADLDGFLDTDLLTLLGDCFKDDLTTFLTGGVGELDEGPTKCDDSDPQTVPFTWSISSDGKRLETSHLGEFDIDELSSSKMVLTVKEMQDETTYLITFVLVH
jgi:hypothetical protein